MKSWPKIDGALADYVDGNWLRDSPLKRRLREETAKMPGAGMQISAHQGQQIGLLARAIGVRRAVEVGTFTGYSSLAMARALPPGGKLLCCDVSEEFTAIARRHWERAGVADRIELRIGPALETLRSLPTGTVIDLAFIDADKPAYRSYYEEILARMRPNGLLLIDNTLWSGHVARDDQQDESTAALRELNDLIARDERVESYILPISDGLTMVRKR